jgi:hypothetical protein
VACLLSCLLLLLVAGELNAQELRAREPQIKAAFLYNFAKLVYWPTNAFTRTNAPFVIGVLGKDSVAGALEGGLTGRAIDGHPIVIARYESAKEATNCHVLFISDTERRNLDTIMPILSGRPILTVSDSQGFVEWGVIELVRADKNFNFRINLETAQRAGLRLSSQLIRLDRNLRLPAASQTNAPPVKLR